MFTAAKLAFFISSLAILAVASSTPQVSQCNTGEMQCCNSVQNINLTTLSQLGGLLGIDVAGLVPTIGLTCSGISVIGIGGGSGCSASPVCCSGTSFSGLISLGCSPLSL